MLRLCNRFVFYFLFFTFYFLIVLKDFRFFFVCFVGGEEHERDPILYYCFSFSFVCSRNPVSV